jgi:hypothetical protein
MQFLETLLLPEVHEPHPFVFFKVITLDENPFADNLPIKSITLTHKRTYSPIVAKVARIDIYDDKLMFLVKSDDKDHIYGVNTDEHYIMENDEIDNVRNTNVEIGNDAENELIQLMKDPSIKKKIPQELKDSPRFKRKVEAEITKGRIRAVDSIGRTTSTVYIPKIKQELDLPDVAIRDINSYLGTDTAPKVLDRAIISKTRRISPQENARASWFSRFRMFGKGTRKNKKKRYGRL